MCNDSCCIFNCCQRIFKKERERERLENHRVTIWQRFWLTSLESWKEKKIRRCSRRAGGNSLLMDWLIKIFLFSIFRFFFRRNPRGRSWPTGFRWTWPRRGRWFRRDQLRGFWRRGRRRSPLNWAFEDNRGRSKLGGLRFQWLQWRQRGQLWIR